MICGTLEWGVGSIGGFCVGSTYIIDHQVLSGLGKSFLFFIDIHSVVTKISDFS